MGGGVVLAAIETHPDAFDGAVSMCGMTQGWLPLVGQMMELRAAYNLLTEGTPYALPGSMDVTRSGLPTVPLAGDPTDGEAFRNAQKMRVIAPVLMLFGAAKADPQGREATIVRQLASIIDAEPDAAVIGAPIYSAVLGMDDIVEVMGGVPAGNRNTVYAPDGMSRTEAEGFNARIQRFDAGTKRPGGFRLLSSLFTKPSILSFPILNPKRWAGRSPRPETPATSSSTEFPERCSRYLEGWRATPIAASRPNRILRPSRP